MCLAPRAGFRYHARMKSAMRSVPHLAWLVTAFVMVTGTDASGQASNYAKKVLHDDGTVTESVSDLTKGELRESTFDSRGVLLSKRIVLLNELGLPVQGVIYSGSDELLGRVQFFYDDLGRPMEERSLNAQGRVFRRKFQLYDQGGRPLPAKVVDYAANAPKVASNSINFTRIVPPPDQGGGAAPAGSQQPRQPGETPQIQSVSPRSGTTTKPAEQKPRNPFKK
jgi:hypothetical protein